MRRKLILTGDGSHSFEIPEMGVTYHSIHGAIQESNHIFIKAGFSKLVLPEQQRPVKIFEAGFGTGLNALLTFLQSEITATTIYYETIEPHPLSTVEANGLNYCEQLRRPDLQPVFDSFHSAEWEKEVAITSRFAFKKSMASLPGIGPPVNYMNGRENFDLIYFDAFDPATQPELWTKNVFELMFSLLAPGGILVTYSSKGMVRRAMQDAGFVVEKLPGPPGKREIIRAVK